MKGLAGEGEGSGDAKLREMKGVEGGIQEVRIAKTNSVLICVTLPPSPPSYVAVRWDDDELLLRSH